ncbi:MAG: 50S ribosomal protein L7ae-like protein [Halanaerobiaceae bacterium]|nr:50S ribosomal protein L7ae-like protein [Halanaerobiaceae bacterium]
MTLAELSKSKNKVVGKKQTINAINEARAAVVFLAEDTDDHIKEEIIRLSEEKDISIIAVDSKIKLGRACGIDVPAACATILK